MISFLFQWNFCVICEFILDQYIVSSKESRSYSYFAENMRMTEVKDFKMSIFYCGTQFIFM